MSKFLLSISAAFCALVSAHADVAYDFVPNWLTPPAGSETIGSGHGEIGVDSAGNIYVSVEGKKEGGLQVYGPDGKFKNYLAGTPGTLHGFTIVKDAEGEFIYATVLGQAKVLKMKLDGTVVMTIETAAFPADKSAKLKLTNVAVANNGDIYVVDGYGADWIFQFDKTGKLKKTFGGRVEPLKLSNCHKLFVDNRFEPARLLLCDRGNNRLLHLNLDGELINVIAKDGLRRPSSASFNGDLVCIAEIAGRVSVWDKEGKQVASLGVNDTAGQTNTPGVKPPDWREGVVTSPHGITFDAKGNILETEWNNFGRVLRWNKK
jgi:hypothetical protein